MYANIYTTPKDVRRRTISKALARVKNEIFSMPGAEALLENSNFTASADREKFTYEGDDFSQLNRVKELMDKALKKVQPPPKKKKK